MLDFAMNDLTMLLWYSRHVGEGEGKSLQLWGVSGKLSSIELAFSSFFATK